MNYNSFLIIINHLLSSPSPIFPAVAFSLISTPLSSYLIHLILISCHRKTKPEAGNPLSQSYKKENFSCPISLIFLHSA